jgi:hypothetical protein
MTHARFVLAATGLAALVSIGCQPASDSKPRAALSPAAESSVSNPETSLPSAVTLVTLKVPNMT